MRNRPVARDLLEIAERVFRDDLLPALPAEKRYPALMVANAIANARREIAAGEVPLAAELVRLQALYPDAPATDEALVIQLERLNRHLAVDIRKGNAFIDRARREQIRTHLVQTAIERVREANPKYLKNEGLE